MIKQLYTNILKMDTDWFNRYVDDICIRLSYNKIGKYIKNI